MTHELKRYYLSPIPFRRKPDREKNIFFSIVIFFQSQLSHIFLIRHIYIQSPDDWENGTRKKEEDEEEEVQGERAEENEAEVKEEE